MINRIERIEPKNQSHINSWKRIFHISTRPMRVDGKIYTFAPRKSLKFAISREMSYQRK